MHAPGARTSAAACRGPTDTRRGLPRGRSSPVGPRYDPRVPDAFDTGPGPPRAAFLLAYGGVILGGAARGAPRLRRHRHRLPRRLRQLDRDRRRHRRGHRRGRHRRGRGARAAGHGRVAAPEALTVSAAAGRHSPRPRRGTDRTTVPPRAVVAPSRRCGPAPPRRPSTAGSTAALARTRAPRSAAVAATDSSPATSRSGRRRGRSRPPPAAPCGLHAVADRRRTGPVRHAGDLDAAA